MQAIILAAGMGKRLGELTRNNTKCMVKLMVLLDRSYINSAFPVGFVESNNSYRI